MTENIQVGQQVPNFTMDVFDPTQHSFGKISLDELKKKKRWTVLFFYPADYTFVCPTELADLGKYQAELDKAGATVISVSTDTQFVHMAWHREETLLKGVRYLMGADANQSVSKLFGVLEESSGLALRGTFIINPEGLLVASEVNFFNVGRNAEELARKVKASIYVAVHPEEACPANWSEGQKTLKPGENLVGRVGDALGKN
jgi:alkyl hydroperoxide reductase subunit AhpC